MINKPRLTPEQKERFEQRFRELMKDASETAQWDGLISWNTITDQPFINFRREKLSGKLADKYTILLNKLNDRSI
jgi:hypothetical protein